MNYIRVQIRKHRGQHLIKIPKNIIDNLGVSDGEEIEISVRRPLISSQTSLWDREPVSDTQIKFRISSETMTMNMYSKIYIPSDLRYLFPPSQSEFILETNAGNIQTHITLDGYIGKGMKAWFIVNHQLEEDDLINFEKLPGSHMKFRLKLRKHP